MNEISLRSATREDIPLLQYWDTMEHVIASDPNDDWQWQTEIGKDYDWREQLIAEYQGKAIGFVEIIDPAREIEHYWGPVEANLRAIDIWIGEPDFLNQGLGTQIMKMAIARCFANAHVTAIINDPLLSNTAAIRFYQRLGFEFVEQRQFGLDLCAVHKLTRATWQKVISTA